MIRADPQLTEKVAVPAVEVRVNEDLDAKAIRLGKALEECNARLDDIAALEAEAERQAKANNTPAPWWRRLFGGR